MPLRQVYLAVCSLFCASFLLLVYGHEEGKMPVWVSLVATVQARRVSLFVGETESVSPETCCKAGGKRCM